MSYLHVMGVTLWKPGVGGSMKGLHLSSESQRGLPQVVASRGRWQSVGNRVRAWSRRGAVIVGLSHSFLICKLEMMMTFAPRLH